MGVVDYLLMAVILGGAGWLFYRTYIKSKGGCPGCGGCGGAKKR